MATGVLPLLIGKGTLCSKYLINHDKIYKVQLTLGIKTDTADGEGKILEKREIPKEILQKEKIASREIEIYKIELIKIIENKNKIAFQVHCSKGTYIRSLCEDIATKLNTIGFMSELERIQVGNFSIKQAIQIEQLQKDNIPYISIEELFKNKKPISVEEQRLHHFLNGVKLTTKTKDGIYRIYSNQKFIGIGVVQNELLKRDIIL